MPDGRLKLADFGFCKQLASRQSVTRTFCGTPEYIAPEIYQKLDYGFPADCWSLGVMIYEMGALRTPFYHSTEIEIKTRVMSGVFQFPVHFSSDLKALLTGLLTKDPVQRWKIDQLRSHSFYSAPYSLEDLEQSRVRCPWKQQVTSPCFALIRSVIIFFSTDSLECWTWKLRQVADGVSVVYWRASEMCNTYCQ